MSTESCKFDDAVAEALANERWSDELREHLSGCALCAELVLVRQSLADVSAVEEAEPLPAAGLIWWRAQLAGRREQGQRALAAIEVMQKLAIAVAVIAIVASVWLWKPGVWSILTGLSMVLATGAVLYGWARGRI